MAIYHLNAQIVSRSQGRSAVACAAYRAAEKLWDEHSGKVHDYTPKQHVAYSKILLCKEAPDWMANREKLWNHVEAIEKRKDAQLARELQLSLPRELSLEQNIALTTEFVQTECVNKGMIADVNIHLDKTPSGENQPHVHVLLSLRAVTPDGFGQKVRAWNKTDVLADWREGWANSVNRHLALHGFDLRVDHRSYAEQQINLEPQHKMGVADVKEKLTRLADHQRIARENGEHILDDPRIALDAITRQQSTFTHQDLARFINRHTHDAEQFQQVYEAVKHYPEIVPLSVDNKGHLRFTTRDMVALEAQLMSDAGVLQERFKHPVLPAIQTTTLEHYTLSFEQKEAFQHLMQSRDINCVIGFAGTGKSYLLGAARVAWEAQSYRVLGATLSGIAAENLTGSSGIDSRTLASRFHQWDKGRERLTAQTILVIDEAGMLGSRQMALVMEQAQQCGAKVVLIGDPEQLQAIEAGAAFRAICEQTGYVSLTEIRRQQLAWQQEATQLLATQHVPQALAAYNQHDHVHAFKTEQTAKQAMVTMWQDVRITHPEQSQIMLAYTREGVKELNDMARSLRRTQGELGEDKLIETERGKRLFAEQDRIYFLQNERSLGVMNGSLATILQIEGHTLTVKLDAISHQEKERTLAVDTRFYSHLEHGYAATVYKAQGVTVDRSYLLASRYWDAHTTYVGLSRHRQSSDVFWSQDVFLSEKDVVKTLSRQRPKDMALDYLGQANLSHKLIPKSGLHHGDVIPTTRNFGQDIAMEHVLQAARQKTADSPREKQILQIEQEIAQLEQQQRYALFRVEATHKLEKYAVALTQQGDTMHYLKDNHPQLAQKIDDLAKSQQRDKDLGRERGF
jgi:Ti-type conjugative transfer relaxase TraA